MKLVFTATKRFFAEIWNDTMLCAMLVMPIVIGLLIKFGFTALENLLATQAGSPVLERLYPMCDMLFAISTPIMLAFASAMTMLGDMDCGIAKALCVTPLGKSGYIASRVIIPSIISMIYGFVALIIFHISDITILQMILCAINGSLTGIVTTLFVTAYAKNKVDGLALAKFSGIIVLGLPVPFFVESSVQYLAGIMPTFWMARMTLDSNLLFALPMLLINIAIIASLYCRFSKKALR